MATPNPYLNQVASANKTAQAWKHISYFLGAIVIVLIYFIINNARNTPTVLVPYGLATSVDSVKVTTNGDISGTSIDYLASVAISDLNLILNVTPDDAEVQVNRFLKRLTPELYGVQSASLQAMASDLKRSGMTQAFYPLETKISKDGSTVEISGTQIGYVGGKEVSHNVVVYIVKYKMYKGYFHVADLRPKNS